MTASSISPPSRAHPVDVSPVYEIAPHSWLRSAGAFDADRPRAFR